MYNKALLVIFAFVMTSFTLISQQKIMSLNIRFDNPSDGEDRWELRKEELCEMLNEQDPDFLGIQEALPNQVEFIDEKLDNYNYIGFGRDGKGTNSESVPLFYKSEDYELLHWQVFWLSETPEIPSKGWDAALNRITTYGSFLDRKTKDTIHVFNTHFDHVGKVAREKSSELLLKKIKDFQLEDKKIIVMGDFNSEPEDRATRILEESLKDAFRNAKHEPSGPVGTFNAFDTEQDPHPRIDYILCRNLEILKYIALDSRRHNNRWISDHLPIMVEIEK